MPQTTCAMNSGVKREQTWVEGVVGQHIYTHTHTHVGNESGKGLRRLLLVPVTSNFLVLLVYFLLPRYGQPVSRQSCFTAGRG
ncbi:hypothetical protein BKA81DRAFT_346751 [Phyllosticta paracitricarpa]